MATKNVSFTFTFTFKADTCTNKGHGLELTPERLTLLREEFKNALFRNCPHWVELEEDWERPFDDETFVNIEDVNIE